MSRIVFLLEEYSAKVLLDGLMPRLFPNLPFLCVPHEGKQDLEKSIPRKLRAWREPNVHFVVLRDNDGGPCLETKKRLVELCKQGGCEAAVVRLACQELESWYFAQPAALAVAFQQETLIRTCERARFREPDSIQQPSVALAQLVERFQKVGGARLMAHALTRESRSRSFQIFMAAIDNLAAEVHAANADAASTE